MTTRTFIQQGQAYGSSTGFITAKIDGNVVYQGPVTTLDEPLPILPNLDFLITNNLYSWTNDIFFEGTQSLELTVENATLLLTGSSANFENFIENNVATGNATSFGNYYSTKTALGIETDPFSNEKIDGVSVPEPEHVGGYNGQWWWTIPAGSTFTATINILAGNVAP